MKRLDEVEIERIKLEAAIQVYRDIIRMLQSRVKRMEKALGIEDKKIISLSIDPPIDFDSKLIKWFAREILDPHKSKYGFTYKFKFIPGSNRVYELKIWIPVGKEGHVKEIRNALNWVLSKAVKQSEV